MTTPSHKIKAAAIWLLGLVTLAASCRIVDPPPPMVIAAGGDVLNSAFVATILQCDLLLDGKVIATTRYTAASVDCGQLVGSASTTKGSHTIAFRITSQTSSPTVYETVGANVVTETSQIMLGDRSQSLATGQAISYSVQLP